MRIYRRRPRGAARQGRGGPQGGRRGSRASSTSTSTSRPTSRRCRCEVDLAKAARYGIKPGDVRRAAGVFMAGEEVGDICAGGQDLPTCTCGARRRPATASTAFSELLLDTPDGTPRAAGRGGRREDHRRPRTRSSGRTARAASTSTPTSPAGTLARWRARSRTPWTGSSFPLGYPPRVLGRVRGAPGRPAPPAGLRGHRPRSGSCCSCRRPSAAGGWRSWSSSPCPWPWSAGCSPRTLGGGVISLGSLVGFLTVLGHRRPQRHPA